MKNFFSNLFPGQILNKIVLTFIILFSMNFNSVFASHFLNQVFIPDVEGHQYQEEIYHLVDVHIVEGYDNGVFKPDKILNRAELLKIAILAFYNEKDLDNFENKECFSDIDSKEWYAKYVCFAKSKNIIEGYVDGRFRPSQKVNYVEAIKIIIESQNKFWSKNGEGLNSFKADSGKPWYQKYQKRAEDYNLKPNEIMDLGQDITRGQTAYIIYNLLNSQ